MIDPRVENTVPRLVTIDAPTELGVSDLSRFYKPIEAEVKPSETSFGFKCLDSTAMKVGAYLAGFTIILGIGVLLANNIGHFDVLDWAQHKALPAIGSYFKNVSAQNGLLQVGLPALGVVLFGGGGVVFFYKRAKKAKGEQLARDELVEPADHDRVVRRTCGKLSLNFFDHNKTPKICPHRLQARAVNLSTL